MEISELASEAMMMEDPQDAEELYRRMTATALDFRALQVFDDWHEELWDLAHDVRKLLPPSNPLPEQDAQEMLPEIMSSLQRMGVKKKKPSRISQEQRQRQAELASLFKRLRQIRQNAWFDLKIETLDQEEYQSRRRQQSEVLARRLQLLEKSRPTAQESSVVARGYLKTMTLWQTLERPSTEEERDQSLNILVDFRRTLARIERYFDERDHVIFLWEEPAEEPDAEEEKCAIRDDVLRLLKELSQKAEE